MKLLQLPLYITAIFLCAFTAAIVTNWHINEEDYVIKFHSRSAKGTIKGLNGEIRFDSTDLQHSHFDVTVDVHTLNTGNKLKNKHALGKSFFDVEHYPTIGFVSDSISRTYYGVHSPSEHYYVYGRLRIKDVTKNIVIPFNFERTGNKGIFKGKFSINRKDYHLRRFAVSKVVSIELNIPVYN
jgi:polyisoprenoid-binding protein YceI